MVARAGGGGGGGGIPRCPPFMGVGTPPAPLWTVAELQMAVATVLAAEKTMTNKELVVKVNALHPEWGVGPKEVRQAKWDHSAGTTTGDSGFGILWAG